MKLYRAVTTIFLAGLTLNLSAQIGDGDQLREFTRCDSLRGTLTDIRTCYDVTYYDLQVKVDPGDSSISGNVGFMYNVVEDFDRIQIDLFQEMNIKEIKLHRDHGRSAQPLSFERECDAVFIDFPETQEKGTSGKFTIFYEGKPRVAPNAPWDGGFSWKKDDKGNDHIGISCQGLGASVWWPTKDHQSDEPDSMRVRCSVPNGLQCISNGNLEGKYSYPNGFTEYDWRIGYPINNYNVSLNIGKYAHFNDVYKSADGEKLDLDYYVLEYNLEKAKEQFKEVKPMLKCFEGLFGKYPFWDDGFALIETPYLGMEHQSGIAYGNDYQSGYFGHDYSGIGLDFDYIIIHEAAHEYWGNSVTSEDLADMWIHEGFGTYTEALYVECLHGYDTMIDYVKYQRTRIGNKVPVIGWYGVNAEGSSDMYPKGSNFLHTLRGIIDDDPLWFDIIKGLHEDHKISIVTTDMIRKYVEDKGGLKLDKIFEQYLTYPTPPVFEYKTKKKGKDVVIEYRWKTDVADFKMPFKLKTNEGWQTIHPTNEWQTMTIKKMQAEDLELGLDWYYVLVDEQK